jgi:hypothetical protein
MAAIEPRNPWGRGKCVFTSPVFDESSDLRRRHESVATNL